MSVHANVPEADTFTTKGPYCYSADEIRQIRRDWSVPPEFTSSACFKCKKTANVVANAGGWHCTCGQYNLLDRNFRPKLHETPDLGPTAADVQAGFDDGDTGGSEDAGCRKASGGCSTDGGCGKS